MRHSVAAWLARGMMAGFLLSSALNALSYFYLSGFRNLVRPNAVPQALGFPLEMWRFGVSYGGAMIDWGAWAINVVFALLLGLAISAVLIWKRKWFGEFEDAMIAAEERQLGGNLWQFSIRGVLLMTTMFAGAAALARAALGAGPEMLLAIYLFGPTALILIAMIPRGIAWQYRVILLTPATIVTVGFAIVLGNRLSIPFDQVTLGIYICWVPQTVFAAICLTVGLAIRYTVSEKSKADWVG